MKIRLNNLYYLKRSDAKRAASVIAEAFMDYPIPGSFISDINKRKTTLKEIFKLELRYSISNETVVSLSNEIKEVAIIRKSTNTIKEYKYIPYLSLSSFRLITSMSGREMKKLTLAIKEIEKEKDSLILPDRTAELFILAVNPACQGEGRSSRLVKPILMDLKEQGYSTLVMTNTETNTAIYTKMGFELINKYYDSRSDINVFFLLFRA